MSTLSRMYRGETDIDFVGRSTLWFRISGFLVSAALLGLIFGGLNLSLDFVGGTAVQVSNVNELSVGEMREVLTPIGFSNARIEELNDGDTLRVRIESVDEATELLVVRTVAEAAGVDLGTTSVETVGPTFGAQIAERALLALVVFLGAAMIFIAWRLEWKMAVAGIAALFHDLIITVGVYALTRFEVTPATVVAVLTILGYSLYDTVVVFDKVRENVEMEEDDGRGYSAHVNDSMNQVLMRSINTSLTSLLPVGSLLFIGSSLLGAGTLRDFALALFVGIGAGTYSSIFVASPILARWKEREAAAEEEARLAEREERRAKRGRPSTDTPASTKTSLQGGRFDSRPTSGTGATPRPPKKRRKR